MSNSFRVFRVAGRKLVSAEDIKIAQSIPIHEGELLHVDFLEQTEKQLKMLCDNYDQAYSLFEMWFAAEVVEEANEVLHKEELPLWLLTKEDYSEHRKKIIHRYNKLLAWSKRGGVSCQTDLSQIGCGFEELPFERRNDINHKPAYC